MARRVTPAAVPDLTLRQIERLARLAGTSGAATRREPSAHEAVVHEAVLAARRTLGRRKGVVSVHWGSRRIAGRRSGAACVVVFVRRKRPRRAVAESRRFPTHIVIDLRGRRRKVRIDVQAVGWPGLLQTSFVNAGANVEIALDSQTSRPDGTLGAVISSNAQQRVLLSGHVAGRTGRQVWACAITGHRNDRSRASGLRKRGGRCREGEWTGDHLSSIDR